LFLLLLENVLATQAVDTEGTGSDWAPDRSGQNTKWIGTPMHHSGLRRMA